MVIEAYQTLEDRNNYDFVLNNAPFKCTRKSAWLGEGYYFWDSEIKWAHQWGMNSYKKKSLDYIITKCKAKINRNCFDLFGSVNCQKEFREVIDVFKKDPKTKNLEDLNVPNVITYMKNAGIFEYDSIRAGDMNNIYKVYFRKGKEYTIVNQRVQICVINSKKTLTLPVDIVYPK